jgi:hypothetical protein
VCVCVYPRAGGGGSGEVGGAAAAGYALVTVLELSSVSPLPHPAPCTLCGCVRAWGFAGRQVNVPQSYGNNLNLQQSHTGDVRVVCWETDVAPDFESEWDATTFVQYETAYREVVMNLRHFPAKVLVLVRNPSNNRIFPAVTMDQNHYDYWAGGGITYSYNQSVVRLWGPSWSEYLKRKSVGSPMQGNRGWGGEWATFQYAQAFVKVKAWMSYPGVRDTSFITVNVVNVEEPPALRDAVASVQEIVEGAVVPTSPIITMQGTDEDTGATLVYSVVAGNDGGAFRMSGASVVVNNSAAVNFDGAVGKKEFNLGVSVSDGVFYSVGLVKIYVQNANDPVKIIQSNLTVSEHAQVNFDPSPAVQFTDEDNDQSPVYQIMAGNVGEAFRINACSGQIRVNQSLNFEVLPAYVLRIRVNDTGVPSTFQEMTLYVTIVDENDPPVLAPATFSLPENSLAGALAGVLPAFDEDPADTLRFVIQEGDSRRFFNITPGGVFDASYGLFAGRTQYRLRLSNNVVATGDGSGEGVVGQVLDFEDPRRARPEFQLNIFVYDGRENPDVDPPVSMVFPVLITDVNDRPTMPADVFTVRENSANGTEVGVAVATDQVCGAARPFPPFLACVHCGRPHMPLVWPVVWATHCARPWRACGSASLPPAAAQSAPPPSLTFAPPRRPPPSCAAGRAARDWRDWADRPPDLRPVQLAHGLPVRGAAQRHRACQRQRGL